MNDEVSPGEDTMEKGDLPPNVIKRGEGLNNIKYELNIKCKLQKWVKNVMHIKMNSNIAI